MLKSKPYDSENCKCLRKNIRFHRLHQHKIDGGKKSWQQATDHPTRRTNEAANNKIREREKKAHTKNIIEHKTNTRK